jgi:hypothetical protein
MDLSTPLFVFVKIGREIFNLFRTQALLRARPGTLLENPKKIGKVAHTGSHRESQGHPKKQGSQKVKVHKEIFVVNHKGYCGHYLKNSFDFSKPFCGYHLTLLRGNAPQAGHGNFPSHNYAHNPAIHPLLVCEHYKCGNDQKLVCQWVQKLAQVGYKPKTPGNITVKKVCYGCDCKNKGCRKAGDFVIPEQQNHNCGNCKDAVQGYGVGMNPRALMQFFPAHNPCPFLRRVLWAARV